MTRDTIDGREAYRDDPDYTAPEMEPDAHPDEVERAAFAPGSVAGAAGLSIGAGGGAFAGEVLAQESEEREQTATDERTAEEAEQADTADADR